MAQLHGLARSLIDVLRFAPWAAVERGLACAVKTEDGTKDAELHPAQV